MECKYTSLKQFKVRRGNIQGYGQVENLYVHILNSFDCCIVLPCDKHPSGQYANA